MMAWRLRFSNGDVKAEMMLPPCNIRSVFHFVVV
jgi:hypothetical protein